MLSHMLASLVVCAAAPLLCTSHAPTDSERVGDPYPLTTCAQAGETLDNAVVRHYDGREVKFCCEGCPVEFEKDLTASLEKLDEQILATQRVHYPTTQCITCDMDVNADSNEFVHNNRMFRTCCVMCEASFMEEPDAMHAKMDALIIKTQLAAYPLNECLVSKESFETEVENPISFVVNNRLVRVCCNHCVEEVSSYPQEYLPVLEAAYAAAQRDDYPMTTCAVSGEELGSMGDPIEVVAGQTLVKLCCKGCVKRVHTDPMKFVAMVQAARAETSETESD